MLDVQSEVFQVPVDPAMEPEYHNIIVHPMDMSQLDKNIRKKMYGSTEAFLADVRWILHNSIIYNGSKYYEEQATNFAVILLILS